MQSTAAKLLFCAFLLSLVFGVWGASDTPASLEPEAAKEAGGSPTEPSEPEDEYLKYVGFDTSKEQCQKWWEDREKLLKENPQSASVTRICPQYFLLIFPSEIQSAL